MSAPLSADLRRRVVRAVELGTSIGHAARRLEFSPSATIKLLQRQLTTGRIEPDRIGGHRRPRWLARLALLATSRSLCCA